MKTVHAFIAGSLVATAFGLGQPALAQEVLRFATWDSDESLAIEQAIAKKFEESHPGVTVQVEAYGGDGYDQKLAAGFGAGNPPDVMYMWNFPQYRPSLMPLDDLLARDSAELDMKDIPEGLLNASRIDGKIYGMPAGFTTHVVFYNTEMFAKAGVDAPKAGWTWDDLRAKAGKFRNEAEKTYGFAVDAKPDPYDFEQFLWSNGTRYISDDGKTLDGYMNSKQAAEVLDMFGDMAKKQEAVTVNVGENTSASALFKSGKIAMLEGAMWNKSGLDDSGVKYAVAPLPAFAGKPVHSAISISAMSIAKDTAKPDLAWDFVKFYASPEAVAMRTNDLPVRTSVAEKKGMTADPVYKPFFDILAVSSQERPAFLKNPKWAQIQENLAVAIEAVITEQGNAQAHLDEAVQRSQRFLK